MKQFGELKVRDYMVEQVTVVDDTERLSHAVGIMDRERLSVLPVVDNQGSVVGILSVTDLLELTHELQSDLSSLPMVSQVTRDYLIRMLLEQGDGTYVRDVMTAPVETIEPDANFLLAARKLAERQYHHLPVVDDQGNLVGILAASDFVRALADYSGLLA